LVCCLITGNITINTKLRFHLPTIICGES